MATAHHPLLRPGSRNREAVLLLQQLLNRLGCGPVDEDGVFGGETESSVRLFQVRRGLAVDGLVGPQTWSSLLPAPASPAPVVEHAPDFLQVAVSQLGVREVGRNRGQEVDEYVRRVGLDPAGEHPWCQAFVYWCFDQAAKAAKRDNPCIRTASCMRHWTEVRARGLPVVLPDDAASDPSLVRPGAVFLMDFGHGKGHTGFVERVHEGRLVTIEGNTNVAGGREGDGVYRRTRTFLSVNLGFVLYAV